VDIQPVRCYLDGHIDAQQILLSLIKINEFFSIIYPYRHTYKRFHIYDLNNDDGTYYCSSILVRKINAYHEECFVRLRDRV